MKPLFCAFATGFFFLFPPAAPVLAAVVISEIAWMGTTASPHHEWIELHNTGSEAVDVTDWTLTDGNKLSISLSNATPTRIIAPGAYVVLERTSDDSAPGAAFLIYTGALVNTGATLALRRADGSLADQVVGGENWQNVGGNNATKETAQRITKGGWTTSAPTPGAPNVGYSPSEPSVAAPIAGTTATVPPVIRSTSRERARPLTLPDTVLSLSINAPSVGYVNQPVILRAEASGVGSVVIDSLSYQWNFGDFFGAEGKRTTHVYRHPGTYVVTLHAHFARHEQTARHEITILPILLSLARNRGGDVVVNNDSPYDIDVSGYRLRGRAELVFPPRSIIAARGSVTVSAATVGADGHTMTALYDAAGVMAASSLPAPLRAQSPLLLEMAAKDDEQNAAAAGFTNQGSPTAPLLSASPDFAFASPEGGGNHEGGGAIANTNLPAALAAASPATPQEGGAPWWPYAALLLLILGGLGGLYFVSRK
jgi:hypothetical protein